MSIFSDLFANAKTFDGSDPKMGISRSIVRELRAIRDMLDDPGYDAAGMSGDLEDEVQVVAAFDSVPTGGTYRLTFNLAGGITFTTDPIAADADSDGGIQDAIDTAAAAAFASHGGYNNGDIVSSSENDDGLDAEDVVLTFDGEAVFGKGHLLTTIKVDPLAAVPVVETQAGEVGMTDEIQTIAEVINATGGTYTLTLNLDGEDPITTAPIAWNATAAQITTAINTAVTLAGTVAGWTNGHIVVADAGSAGISDGEVTLTFSGDSVDETDHGLTEIDGSNLTGDDGAYLDEPSVTVTNEGGGLRPALAALVVAGVIKGTLPGAGDAPGDVEAANGFEAGPNPNRLSTDTIKALALQASIDDGRDALYQELLDIIGV